jgi:hypothetical protein
MPQIMIYLDEETEQVMRKAAERVGLPYSRWVAGLIRAAGRTTWPQDFLKLSGAFPDAPLADEIRATDSPDSPREPW